MKGERNLSIGAAAEAPSAPGKLVYTIGELCDAVGICRTTLYKEIKEERLRVRKVGKRTLVPVDEVRAWLKL